MLSPCETQLFLRIGYPRHKGHRHHSKRKRAEWQELHRIAGVNTTAFLPLLSHLSSRFPFLSLSISISISLFIFCVSICSGGGAVRLLLFSFLLSLSLLLLSVDTLSSFSLSLLPSPPFVWTSWQRCSSFQATETVSVAFRFPQNTSSPSLPLPFSLSLSLPPFACSPSFFLSCEVAWLGSHLLFRVLSRGCPSASVCSFPLSSLCCCVCVSFSVCACALFLSFWQ